MSHSTLFGEVVSWVALLAVSSSASAQVLAGFASFVSGQGYSYSAHQQGHRLRGECYWVATKGEQSLTWNTAAVPAEARDGEVTFVLGVNLSGPRRPARGEFEVLLEGEHLVTFAIPVAGDATWREGDAELRFEYTSGLIWDDVEGLLKLTVPASRVKPGQPSEVTLRSQDNGEWTSVCLSALPLTRLADIPTYAPPQLSRKPTVQELQYRGDGPYELFWRPTTGQGLTELLSRGRVKPYELLGLPAGDGVRRESERTIFRDEYTGAEVWRLTNDPQGVVRHDYSAYQAWNANGRMIRLSSSRGTMLLDQETGRIYHPSSIIWGQWSAKEPDIIFGPGEWQGVPAVVAWDVAQRKTVRGIGPIREVAAVSPVSDDGKWVLWKEGPQDYATTVGVGAADGSCYRSISLLGGIVDEQKPPTFAKPGGRMPALEEAEGGAHQMYFTRSLDNSFIVQSTWRERNSLSIDRIYSLDGKLLTRLPETLSHVSWQPYGGKLAIFASGGVTGWDPATGKYWPILEVAEQIEAHSSWTSYDPKWSAASQRTLFAGEIIRVSMLPDKSVIRLCGSCPANPDTTAYDNDEFASLSPDGTKVLFMSSMSGSVNEYLVVAANPRAPKLSGRVTRDGLVLTWTPDLLSREIRGYRVYRTEHSGQGYHQIGGLVEGTSFTVPEGRGHFFAVRAEEWSGLLSRYSNEVARSGRPVARSWEAEECEFAGFRQGFDPLRASDLYYLFVPKEGTECSLSFDAGTGGTAWARVAGKEAAFAVTAEGKRTRVAARHYDGWTWVELGRLEGRVTISSDSMGFRVDRLFITPYGQTPVGRGLDHQPDAGFAKRAPCGVTARALTPFTVSLTWAPVPGRRYYQVYGSDRPDFAPDQSHLLYSPPGERVVDWGLRPGRAYYYRIVAVDYDGTESRPSELVRVETLPLATYTQEVEYEAGVVSSGASVVAEDGASGGKHVMLDEGQRYALTFALPAEGDYAIWHRYRSGAYVSGEVEVDGAVWPWRERYDMTSLYGSPIGRDWVWHRLTFGSEGPDNGIIHLTAGEHTLGIRVDGPISLDELVITSDLSYVPEGKLCTF